MLDYIVMQMRKTNREKGYCGWSIEKLEGIELRLTTLTSALSANFRLQLPKIDRVKRKMREELKS